MLLTEKYLPDVKSVARKKLAEFEIIKTVEEILTFA